MIKLVALDIDGTLTGDDQISERVRSSIARVIDRGIAVTLATGRMVAATLPYAEQVALCGPLICYQGGWIQAPGGPILHRTPLEAELALRALKLGEREGWHTMLYADGQLFLSRMLYARNFYERLLAPNPQQVEALAAILATHTADKVLFIAEPNHIPAMARKLETHFDGKAEVVQSHAQFVEVVPPDVTKGRALAWLADYLHAAQSEVLAVGDQQNDLSMLQWAGFGVAMANAVDAVKEAADWIAPSVDKDGAAVALDRWVLKGETP